MDRLVRILSRSAACVCFVAAAQGCSSESSAPTRFDGIDVAADATVGDTSFRPDDAFTGRDVVADASAEGGLGWPCLVADDCVSGWCIQPAPGPDRICATPCDDDCGGDFACLPFVDPDAGAVELCLPTDRVTCLPCGSNTDCGHPAARCAPTRDGRFCLLPCDVDGACADGLVCDATSSVPVCRTELDVCAGCVDRDRDGFGLGPDCAGADCDDRSATTFEGADELCNGADDDCDGTVDEGFDFDSDPSHCGACGAACPADNAEPACVAGACAIESCVAGFSDCNGRVDDGCERADDALNACGGCDPILEVEGTPCGSCETGTWVCDGVGAMACIGDAGPDALNACGGCEPLDGTPGATCGVCGSGTIGCDGLDALSCVGAGGDELRNACGGCAELDATPGDACGTCRTGVWACADDAESLTCAGDEGGAARNACGGCDPLPTPVGDPCGPCLDGRQACAGINAVTCVGATADSDADSVCDDADVCPDGDDTRDRDGDGTPDDCDLCPDDRTDDSDADGVCDGVDRCAGGDDRLDEDDDDVPDACDRCIGIDDAIDADGDDVPDLCDCDDVMCEGDATCTETRRGALCGCPDGFVLTLDGCISASD